MAHKSLRICEPSRIANNAWAVLSNHFMVLIKHETGKNSICYLLFADP